jgi:hypothetical protein
MAGKSKLGVCRCCHRVSSAGKGDEERIPLHIDLVAVPLLEHGTQELTALRQHVWVALAQLLEQVRRSFDVSEEQRDGSRWQVTLLGSPRMMS